MTKVVLVIVDLLYLIYTLLWLSFLIRRHFGQASTRAGHIFELNVLLNLTVTQLLILLIDLDAIPWDTLSEILHTTMVNSYLVALAASQIETAMFLKTLNVNTIMIITAVKICLVLPLFCLGMGVICTLVLPPLKLNQNENSEEICEFLTPKFFFRTTISSTVVLAIVLSVIGFAVFRSHQIRKTSDYRELVGHEMGYRDTLRGPLLPERLFTIPYHEAVAEVNTESGENHGNVEMENPLVVQDIDQDNIEQHVLNRVSEGHDETPENVDDEMPDEMPENLEDETPDETPENLEDVAVNVDIIEAAPPMEELSISMMINELQNLENGQNNITENQGIVSRCLPIPGKCILQTLNKYLKNALISLLILTSELPWYLTAMYGLITSSGCENSTLRLMSEFAFSCWYGFHLFLPFLIKIKLERLSE